MTIYEAKPEVYLDENLARPLKVFKAVDGSTEKFIGVASIQPAPGMQPLDIPFEIEAKDIDDAYKKYDE